MKRLLVPLMGALALACAGEAGSPEEQGRRVYVANCIACHNMDPTKEGTLGPPVAGSSRELLEARVIKGVYPDGYPPKRDSTLMQPLPYLAGDLEALAAYLASLDGA